MSHPNLASAIATTPVVLFCGGKGLILDESGNRHLKGLILIQGEPLLVHLVRSYIQAGFRRFVLCAGYQQDAIKKVLIDQYQATAKNSTDYQLNLAGASIQVEVIDTGEGTTTGDRLKKVASRVSDHPVFCVNYSDTLSDLNIKDVFEYHLQHGKVGTLVATRMPTRFRILGIRYGDPEVKGFAEKAVIQNDLINGGYYVFNREIFGTEYLGRDSRESLTLETDILEELVQRHQLMYYRTKNKWQHLDTERDLKSLNEIAGLLQS